MSECTHRGGHGDPRIVRHDEGGVYCILCNERWVPLSKLEHCEKIRLATEGSRDHIKEQLALAHEHITGLEAKLSALQEEMDELEKLRMAEIYGLREKHGNALLRLGNCTELIRRVYNDLLMRAELKDDTPVVAVGASVWRDLCDAVQGGMVAGSGPEAEAIVRKLARETAGVVERTMPEDDVLRCLGCGLPYQDFALDVLVPDEVWAAISGRSDGSGVMCAACIVEHGAKLPGVSVAKLVFE